MKDRVTGPLFKWFGSKWTASKHYPEPIHDTVVEPFAGSAGYALRHHGKKVVLAESNRQVLTLWRWLALDATESLIREIPINVPEGTDIREIGLTGGQELLLKHWQRTNNVGDCWTVSAWGNKPGQWTENTRSRVASERHLVAHWEFHDDAFRVMRAMEGPATWFVDPPYRFNYGYRSAPVDYEALGAIVRGLPGQVIACEAACQKTGALPDWLPFKDFRRTVTSRRKPTDNHHSRELVYVKG